MSVFRIDLAACGTLTNTEEGQFVKKKLKNSLKLISI